METGLSVPLPHASPSQKEQRLGQDLDSEGEEREPRSEAPPGGVAGGGVTPAGRHRARCLAPTRPAGTWFSGDVFSAHRTVGFKSGKPRG